MKSIETSTFPKVFETAGASDGNLALALESLTLENESLRMKNAEMEAKIRYYEEQLRLAAARKYGASSEKNIHPEQISIFNEAEKENKPELPEPTLEEITYKRRRGTRKPTAEKYDALPVDEVHYELPEEERVCGHCGGRLKDMGTETRDEIVVIPATVRVKRHVQHKYVCNNERCQDEHDKTNIVIARAQEAPIPHSPAGPSMIAHIMSRKFSEHVPLYRQEQQFGHYGITIPRRNMANWVIKGAELLTPLCDRLHVLLLAQGYAHADETSVQVLCEPGKKATSKSYMWLYATGRFRERIFLYEYQPSRAGEHPKKFLAGFGGYLQVDGYQGYNLVEDVTLMLCFAHARREYTDALKALPEDADKTKTLATEGLAYIDRLFVLEKSYESMTPEKRYEARLEKTKPVLDAYRAWLTDKTRIALPKGKLAGAVNYSLKHWDKLCTFLKDGEIEISNNDAENAIRPFALGRKNWLFAKSQNGAKASATVYSIIETAKANGLAPFRYLKYLFERL
jgi:transposase